VGGSSHARRGRKARPGGGNLFRDLGLGVSRIDLEHAAAFERGRLGQGPDGTSRRHDRPGADPLEIHGLHLVDGCRWVDLEQCRVAVRLGRLGRRWTVRSARRSLARDRDHRDGDRDDASDEADEERPSSCSSGGPIRARTRPAFDGLNPVKRRSESHPFHRVEREETPRARDAFELVGSPFMEVEAGAGDKVDDRLGHQHLSRCSQARDAGRGVHGDPARSAGRQLRLPEVESRPHLEADRPRRRQDRCRASDCVLGDAEPREERIAGRVYLVATETAELSADQVVVGGLELAPSTVTDLHGDLRGAHDVGEEQRCEVPARSTPRHSQIVRGLARANKAPRRQWGRAVTRRRRGHALRESTRGAATGRRREPAHLRSGAPVSRPRATTGRGGLREGL